MADGREYARRVPRAPKYIAVRCYPQRRRAGGSWLPPSLGRRGRRLVIDRQTGDVTELGLNYWLTMAWGMAPAGLVWASDIQQEPFRDVFEVEDLRVLMERSWTPYVLVDEALSEYVNEHDGRLPLEGQVQTVASWSGLRDDFVDMRPEAVVLRKQAQVDRPSRPSEPPPRDGLHP